MQRILSHLRSNVIAYLAIVLAAGATGGYAIAATSTKTINACVVKSTGELLIKTRCSASQSKLTWNQQGPIGPKGQTGATGPAGQAPPSAWAIVSDAGVAEPTDGISVQHTATGTYQVTVTATACVGAHNAPVVEISQSDPLVNPPEPAGAFPVSWVGETGTNQFTVYTGDVVSGTFTLTGPDLQHPGPLRLMKVIRCTGFVSACRPWLLAALLLLVAGVAPASAGTLDVQLGTTTSGCVAGSWFATGLRGEANCNSSLSIFDYGGGWDIEAASTKVSAGATGEWQINAPAGIS